MRSGSVSQTVGAGAPSAFLSHFTVFVLACFVGYMVIWNVTPSLHTPLMSVTNAISSIIAIGALAFLAVGSVLIVHRSRSERAGATFIALAVWGSLALSQTEIRAILEGNGHTVWHLAARVGIVVGSLALTWRWIEDIALAASLLPNDDPHPVDRATDEEATHVATLGPSGRGSASRQLSSALGIRERSHGAIADPGLSGRGSPIPRVMPTHDDEPQPASSGV